MKEKIVLATCSACLKTFWQTEGEAIQVKAGNKECLCSRCEVVEPFLLEDDNSEEFDYQEPQPEDR